MNIIFYISIGLVAGFAGGALGIGGGTVMVPILVLFLGLTQHQAQGTALAVLMVPVFILAVMRYYHEGNVNIQIAAFIAMGFLFGALLGAHVVQGIPSLTLRKIFGIVMILVGIKMMFFK